MDEWFEPSSRIVVGGIHASCNLVLDTFTPVTATCVNENSCTILLARGFAWNPLKKPKLPGLWAVLLGYEGYSKNKVIKNYFFLPPRL